MTKRETPATIVMNRVQSPVAAFLKMKGFTRRGRTFNRTSSDGLVEVINFQMGSFAVGGHAEIPQLRPNLYGKFTLNLGVYVPEIWQVSMVKKGPGFVQEYHCSLRSRLSQLNGLQIDQWWDLSMDVTRMTEEIIDLLNQYGLRFLEKFSTREEIIVGWPQFCEQYHLSPRPLLDVAIILNALGRKEEAREFFNRHRSGSHPPAHLEYLNSLAQTLGLA